ncbi:hypothetical protein HW44_02400, partial [Nitrosococcus oceani]
GGHHHIAYTHINTDTVWLSRQGLKGFLAHERNTITTRAVLGDRHHLGHTLGLAGPLEFECPEFGEFKKLARSIPSRYLALVKLIADALSVGSFFETGILCSPCKKMPEGRVLVPELLHEAIACRLVQPGVETQSLEKRQLPARN